MGLTISFVILCSLVLWLTISLKGNWVLKSLIILTTLVFSATTFISIENFYGWPTTQPMPESFRIHWAFAEEPNRGAGADGALFFWVEEISKDVLAEKSYFDMAFKSDRGSQVRAHKVPYSELMHLQVMKITEKLIAGEIVVGFMTKKPDMPNDFLILEDNENGMGQSGTDVMFYSLPPSGPPKKAEQ